MNLNTNMTSKETLSVTLTMRTHARTCTSRNLFSSYLYFMLCTCLFVAFRSIHFAKIQYTVNTIYACGCTICGLTIHQFSLLLSSIET